MTSKKIVGITGGIGSGKTFVCQILETMGYPVFYSDKEAKLIIANNKQVKLKIIALFGKESYLKSGKINRQHLAKQIFENQQKLEQMNAIVHPAVRLAFENWTNKQNSNIVFNEAAIIFETGIYKRYDFTILVTAPKQIKIKRILKRDNSSLTEIEKRMNNQWLDEKKQKLANFIINNDEKQMLLPQIIEIIKGIE